MYFNNFGWEINTYVLLIVLIAQADAQQNFRILGAKKMLAYMGINQKKHIKYFYACLIA